MSMRVGIIGCGNIAKFHIAAFEKIGVEIVYLADVRESVKETAERLGAKFTTDYRELIASPFVTCVCLCGIGSIHKDVCLRALEAGKDVICEKTMADNEQDAYEIAVAAEQARGMFFTAFMKRHFPAVKQAKECMAKIGTVISAQFRSLQPWGNFYIAEHGWNMDAVLKTYGGAIVKCAGSHMLDMMMLMLGRPTEVSADVRDYPGTRFDIRMNALFGFADGTSAFFETAAHPLRKIGYERNSWDEGFRIVGTKGTLELATVMWDYPERNAPILRWYDDETERMTEFRFDIVNPFDEQARSIRDSIQSGRRTGAGAAEGYAVDNVIETVFRAAREKRTLPLVWRA